jgi:hypothetical protein
VECERLLYLLETRRSRSHGSSAILRSVKPPDGTEPEDQRALRTPGPRMGNPGSHKLFPGILPAHGAMTTRPENNLSGAPGHPHLSFSLSLSLSLFFSLSIYLSIYLCLSVFLSQ